MRDPGQPPHREQRVTAIEHAGDDEDLILHQPGGRGGHHRDRDSPFPTRCGAKRRINLPRLFAPGSARDQALAQRRRTHDDVTKQDDPSRDDQEPDGIGGRHAVPPSADADAAGEFDHGGKGEEGEEEPVGKTGDAGPNHQQAPAYRRCGTIPSMANIGITTWIWTAPLTTAEFERIAPHIKQLGFDIVEVPIEGLNDLDYRRAADLLRDLGLGATVCAAMGPDRDLIHSDPQIRANGLAYVRHCIDAAQTLKARHVLGPLYSAVGRTWQATDEEREKDVELLVRQLRDLSTYAATKGVGHLRRAAQSLRDELSQSGGAGDRGRRSRQSPGLPHPARHVPHEHRGAIDRRRDSRGGRAGGPGPHVRERPRRAGLRARALAGEVGRRSRHHLRRPARDRVVHAEGQDDRRAAAIWRPLASSPDALAKDGLKFLRQLMNWDEGSVVGPRPHRSVQPAQHAAVLQLQLAPFFPSTA